MTNIHTKGSFTFHKFAKWNFRHFFTFWTRTAIFDIFGTAKDTSHRSSSFTEMFFFLSFQIIMAGKRLALFFLLIVAVELTLLCITDASPWSRRRRRRRRAAPVPPPCSSSLPYSHIKWLKWLNTWHQSFYAHCPNGEVLACFRRSYSINVFIELKAEGARIEIIYCELRRREPIVKAKCLELARFLLSRGTVVKRVAFCHLACLCDFDVTTSIFSLTF